MKLFRKKPSLKRFLISWERELCSPKLKKLLTFWKMKLSYIFSKKAFLNFQEMKLFKKFSFISGGKFNWPYPSKFLMFFPKKFLKKFLIFCKIELSRSQLKKLFIFHKNGAFLYFLKKKKKGFSYISGGNFPN